ncbi:thioredoxin TrxC [Marinomonas sp. PE14-40]|uniref:thioredoxin TrxC n=1 Tax=Marinomonas sp. PE14-40 TaxID=3060621 RepID=UPI003F68080B
MTDSTHLVCQACLAVNRIPSTRLADSPKCGKCQTPIFNAKPIDLTAANYQKHLQRNDLPVLVDFWAPWCGPCKMMGPQFEQAAGQLEPKVRLAKVNTEAEQQLGAQLNIRSIPTLIIFKGGKEIARHSGAMGAADIIKWTRSYTG